MKKAPKEGLFLFGQRSYLAGAVQLEQVFVFSAFFAVHASHFFSAVHFLHSVLASFFAVQPQELHANAVDPAIINATAATVSTFFMVLLLLV